MLDTIINLSWRNNKLYEELLIGGYVSKTDNPMILRAEEEMLAWDDLKLILDELELAADSGDQGKLRQLLIKAVPGLKPQSNITDILYEAWALDDQK